MFSRIIQPGLLCIFDADHERPLKLWEKKIREGQIKRTVSDEIKGLVLEISSKLPMTSFIHCPASVKQNLGIYYQFFHMIVKLSYSSLFIFDILVVDDKDIKRRLRMSTIQTYVDIQPFMCKLPLVLEPGWNHLTIQLQYYVKHIYGTNYVRTLRVAVYPNCYLKRIYFSDREYTDEEVPPEFHLEDIDVSETYRSKYTTMTAQKTKNFLSYYTDLIQGRSPTVSSHSANKMLQFKKILNS